MSILKRLVDYLAPAGFILAIGAIVWARFTPFGHPLPGGLRPWLIAAAALVLVHLILRWEDATRYLGVRQVKYGTNTFVLVVVVLLILGGVNYLVNRHTKRIDLTKNQRYSLAEQTKKVVQGLESEVTITYFQRERDMDEGRDRLREYEALSDRLKVEFVDPVKNPTRAQAFDITTVPTLILQRGERRERISSVSEQDITNALIKVTREGSKTVCFVEGEGERSTEDSAERGYSGAKSALTDSQYEVESLFLLREKTVPEKCTVVVVAGPEKDLTPEAISPLREYVRGGGKLLAMVEPEFKESYPNLVGLLEEWNIQAGNDVVVDISGVGQIFGASELAPLVMDYPSHEITRDFRVMTLFAGARSMQAGEGSVEGVTAQNLARTSEQSWAETTLKTEGALEYEEDSDRLGPISLAAVATVKGEAPASSEDEGEADEAKQDEGSEEAKETEKEKAPEGRVVAVGDADFASNQLLGFQGNQDFFLNVVAWLAEDADLISVRPKEPENQSLFLSRQVQQNVAWVALVILPLIFVVAGVVTWWRRR
ncbi:MAG: GldG family protein [Acidobacteria bacterium]|jgi:ABC-type uncharacterized transport system involved in gliding motility auxiliary subunit|nr:GldG family protein [Acidobacteriota bacterium]